MKRVLIAIVLILAINLVTRPAIMAIGKYAMPLVLAEVVINKAVANPLNLVMPEGLAVLEHVLNKDLLYIGRCRIDNIRGIYGNGILVLGDFKRPDNGKIEKHVRGYANGTIVENTCQGCIPESIDAAVKVKGYKIIEVDKFSNDFSTQLNLRYVKGALYISSLLRR